MKILEICPYSSGICGVFARVKEESKRLRLKGYEVMIFSSNFEKGTNKIVKKNDKIEEIEIIRFKAYKPGLKPLHFIPGGESYMFWNFKEDAIKFEPDVIITHNYRHFHNDIALNVRKQLLKNGKNCKVFLVTHAPFPEGDITRSFWGHSATWFYDFFIGRLSIKKYDKIITISNWERPFLDKIGANKSNIEYIPNGIPEEFFFQKKEKEEKKILFLGRISPKKKIETIISALPYLDDDKIKLEIVGPKEVEYFSKLIKLIKELKLEKRVIISEPIFDTKKKIKKIDSANIFILPSRVEGMPQSLIEGMSRGKIVIGSDSMAIRDLIIDGKNGYLFKFDNPKSLADVVNKALKSDNKKLRKNAIESVKEFDWKIIINKIEKLIKK